MKVIVCIKQVPDTTNVRINPETNTLVREGVQSIINPFDVYAIEEAVRIREKQGGTVTVITMGPPQAVEALRESISLGADSVYLVSDRAFAGADTLATAYALACAIRKLDGADIILMGRQAIDGDTGQVGPGRCGEPGDLACHRHQEDRGDRRRQDRRGAAARGGAMPESPRGFRSCSPWSRRSIPHDFRR